MKSNRASAEMRITIRPPRIAYFVPNESDARWLDAVRLASSHRGGIRNLIVPVDSATGAIDLEDARNVILHDPDAFAGFLDQSQREMVARTLIALLPGRVARVFMADGMLAENQFARTAFMPASPTPIRVARVARLGRTASAAIFGVLDGVDRSVLEQRWQLETVGMRAGSSEFWQAQLDTAPQASILNVGQVGLRTFEVHNPSIGGGRFDIVVGDSIRDLCRFWNMRATREVVDGESNVRRTILVPFSCVGVAALRALKQCLVARHARPGYITDVDCFIMSAEDSKAKLARALAGAGFRRYDSTNAIDAARARSPKRPRTRLSYAFHDARRSPPTWARRISEGIGDLQRSLVEIAPGETEVMVAAPTERLDPGLHALDLDARAWHALPRSDDVAGSIRKNARFGPRGLTMFVIGGGAGPLTLNIPTIDAALRAFGNTHQLALEVLDSGHQASALVEAVGDLRDVGPLSKRWVYDLLPQIARQAPGKLAQAVVARVGIPRGSSVDAVAEALREFIARIDLLPQPRTLAELHKLAQRPQPEFIETVEYLVNRGVLRRGVCVACASCRLRLFYSLADLDDDVRCGGCGSRFRFPVREHASSTREPSWSYIVSPLFDRALDQDYLPAIMAARAIARRREGPVGHAFNVGVTRAGSAQLLTDLDSIVFDQLGTHVIEAKAGGSLDRSQATRVATVAAELNCTSIVFATAGKWDAEANVIIADLATTLRLPERRVSLITIEGDQMFDAESA